MKARFKTRLPLVNVKLHNANTIKVPHKLCIDSGYVHFDLDTLEEGRVYEGGEFLHIGISGPYRVQTISSTDVKDHIDIYIPKAEIKKIINGLKSIEYKDKANLLTEFVEEKIKLEFEE